METIVPRTGSVPVSHSVFGDRLGLVGFGAVLALGLIVSAWIAADTFERVKRSDQAITVKGYAEQKITSDYAAWRGRFAVQGKELVSTYDRLTADLATVLGWLKQQGVAEKAIEVSSVQTEAQYARAADGTMTNQIEGYVLTQTIDVEGADIALISAIAKQSTGLIREGIAFNSDAPKYFYTKINDLKIEMLGEATKDARVRAEQLASNSGGRVGALRGAEQGVFQITSVHSTDVSGYGELDTESIYKSIKAIVTISYAIE